MVKCSDTTMDEIRSVSSNSWQFGVPAIVARFQSDFFNQLSATTIKREKNHVSKLGIDGKKISHS